MVVCNHLKPLFFYKRYKANVTDGYLYPFLQYE